MNHFRRFANLLLHADLDRDLHKLWDITRKIKSDIVFRKCSIRIDFAGLYGLADMESNVRKVEEQLNVNSVENIYQNMTGSKLEEGFKMFLYLNMCSEVSRSWLRYYTDLLKNHSPNKILLALNRHLKASGRNTLQDKGLRKITKNLLERIYTELSLRFKEIQKMTKGFESSVSIAPLNIRGMHFLLDYTYIDLYKVFVFKPQLFYILVV